MDCSGGRLLRVTAFAALVCVAVKGLAQTAPSLGSAASFAVLGESVVIQAAPTHISGNLGAGSGGISGVAPVMRVGEVRNDLAGEARRDAVRAYDDLATRACTPLALDGTPIPSGVYCLTSPNVTDSVTLDARNNPDSVWIFRTAGPLVFANSTRVLVINGGHNANVFWQVGGSATLGADSVFIGSLLAISDITLDRGATVSGRLLARNERVTLNGNEVSLCCAPIAVFPATLPGGAVGASYNQTITATGGTESFTKFEHTSGILPEGLTLLPNGMLSGKPTRAGPYRFTVTATDSHLCTGTREYTIPVGCGTTTIELSLTKDGGKYTVEASGGTPPYTYSVTSGSLPAGMRQDPETTVVSGTPTTTCSARFTVTATDKNGCSGSRTFTICLITILPETLPNGFVGMEYSQTISACGAKEFLFDELPDWLKPPPLGDKLSGTPTQAGIYKFTVTTVDDLSCIGMRTYQLVVCGKLDLSPALPDANACEPYYVKLEPSGGVAPYSFAARDGTLPDDLHLNPATGEIFGTPKTPGNYTVIITLKDALAANGCPGREFSLPLRVVCHITISPPSLPDGVVGVGYSEQLTACGGTPDYTFAAPPLSLPPGLTLPSGGLLSGMPTAPGSYTFTVTATDSKGCSGDREYTINVLAVPPGGPIPTLSGWGMGLLVALLTAVCLLTATKTGE